MSKPDYIPTLDGVRGLAILLVLLHHSRLEAQYNSYKTLSTYLQPGYFGVDIFFVLSGFLITRILLSDRDNQKPLKYFFFRRALRIFPLYYLILAICLLFAAKPAIWWSAVYLSNFYFSTNAELHPLRHTWSLAIEEHFYFLWPFLVYKNSDDRLIKLILFVIFPFVLLLGLLAVYLGDAALLHEYMHRGSFFRFGSLAAGALLALKEIEVRSGKLPRAVATVAIAIIGFACLYYMGEFSENSAASRFLRLISFLCISTLVVTLSLRCKSGGLFSRFLSSPLLQFFGKISYGLYLIHYIIYYYLFDYRYRAFGEIPSLSRVAGTFVISIIAASASYFLFERKILGLKQRWS